MTSPPVRAIAKAEQNPKTTLTALITNVVAMATSLVPLVVKWDQIVHVLGPVMGGIIVALGALAIASTCVAAAGASIIKLLPRDRAEHDAGAAPSSDSGQKTAEEPMSALSDAIKPLAAVAVAEIKTVFDAQAPALAADIEKSAPARITLIKTELEAALPKNGILANAESAVVNNALTAAATAIDNALPAGVTYLEGLVDSELATLEKNLSS